MEKLQEIPIYILISLTNRSNFMVFQRSNFINYQIFAMQSIRRKSRKMSMTTFQALTPEAQRLYDFDNFNDFLAPESDPKNNLTISSGGRHRKLSNKDMLETIHERTKNRSRNRARLSSRSENGAKTQRNYKTDEKPNYSETYSNFLNHFKKQNYGKAQSYHPDKFFDQSMLNKLEVRNLQPCLRKRCKVEPKSRFEDYRMKGECEVKNYYDELNSKMIKRSSYSETKNQRRVAKVDQENQLDLTQDFLLFKKGQSGIIENMGRLKIGQQKQRRMLNRFFQSHLLVKGKLSQNKSKDKPQKL